MLSAVEDKIEILAGYPKEIQVWVPSKKVLPEIAHLKVPEIVSERQELSFAEAIMNKKVVQQISLTSALDMNDQGEEVVRLQNFLITRGYLTEGLNTGYYGRQTEAAVLKFQIEQGIVSDSYAAGAGRVGPQTLAVINSF